MKLAALIWLACVAIYLELLVRARRGRSLDEGSWWFSFMLYSVIAISVAWAAMIGWLAVWAVRGIALVLP